MQRRFTNSMPHRFVGAVTAIAVTAGTILAVSVAAAPQASAADPQHVDFGLDGCRNDGSITLPIAGKFICPTPAYTAGNLGKGWNELDLVPIRIFASAGTSAPATQTYSFVMAVDNCSGTDGATGCTATGDRPGFDDLSSDLGGQPELNAALSTGTCGTVSTSGLAYAVSAGTTILYRTYTITGQAKNSNCVYDVYARLAVGSHLYPGSSLHMSLLNTALGTAGIGGKVNSIPVNQILPQSLQKDMTASQGASFVWDVSKQATPANLDFSNTCDPSAPLHSGVEIVVTWHRNAATPGDITIITHVYATNPAARSITVTVTDSIYAGLDQSLPVLDTTTTAPTVVPANTTQLLLTHTISVAAGTATNFNDIATGAYTDTVTGVPIPQTTTATANAAVQTTSSSNDTAVITDTESISGSGLTYSVDSATGASGSFSGGYIAGTQTTADVTWVSDSQSGNGSVTFEKTVDATAATAVSGNLHDEADLLGNGGFTTSAKLDVGISVNAAVTLTIDKTIPNVLTGTETASFTFHVTDSSNVEVATPVITFNAGDTHLTAVVPGLAPDTYTVSEDTATHWLPQNSQQVNLQLPTCSGTAFLVNNFGPASAGVQKITVPSGSQGGWTFTLTGPGTPVNGEQQVTDSGGLASFTTVLQQGSYTITETQQTGWDQTGSSGDCSFTVNYPNDAGRVFTCTITNTQRGLAKVIKTVNNAPPSGTQSFTFQLRQGATTSADGTILQSLDATSTNGGVLNFTPTLVAGQHYQICEIVMPGWNTTLGPNPFVPNSVNNPNVDNSVMCVDFVAVAGQTTTFTVNNTPPPGGGARTIGFWKNWASCAASNGKQKPVLDQTLGKADPLVLSAQSGTYPGFAAAYYLVLHAGDCTKAVSLLNKTPIGGKKAASDPAFNLAAQLLAAELNYAAGAAMTGAATSAINQAVVLLGKYQFDGVTHTKISSADANTMNSLATILDHYNNGI